jgi:hypothetical protein
MHRTKCSGIIQNVLAPHFAKKLCEDIADNPFSLLLDESTDITTDKYLGCTIIYYSYDKKKIVNSFLELTELETLNADAIVSAILNILKKYNLKIKNLKGIGTDNASVMTGINNGVYTKLKEFSPNLILIRCVCHSLQLAVSAAAKEFLPTNLEFLIRETYNWFAHSSLRQQAYKQFFNLINEGENPLKITQSCATRWLSIETAVSRIFNQWLELKTHFGIAREKEKCYTAQILYDMYNDDSNYAYLCFLKPILADVQRVNKAFESNNADSTKLFDDLTKLLEGLVQKLTTPNTKFKLFKDEIDSFVNRYSYLGYLFEHKMQEMKAAGFREDQILRNKCIDFLIKLIKEITNRLPDNIDLLRQMSTFSVDSTLKVIKPSLINLLEHFKYPPAIIENIESQWRKITLIKWQHVDSTIGFWSEVIAYKDSNGENPFKDLADFALSFLVLPHSNAEVERLFSQMNIVKSKLRNKMQLPMLRSILHIRSGLQREECCCYNYDIPTNVIKQIKSNETYSSDLTLGLDIDFDIFI